MSELREDLKAYVDGELSPSRVREIEAAIAADPNLRAEVAYLRQLSFEITQVARDVDIRGATETLARLRKPRRNVFLTPVLSAIGCLVVIAVTYPLWQSPLSIARSTQTQADKAANAASASTPTLDANPPSSETFRGVPGSGSDPAKGKGTDFQKSEGSARGSFAKAGVERATTQGAGGGGSAPPQQFEIEIAVASTESARQSISALGSQSVEIEDALPPVKYANPARMDVNTIDIQVQADKVAETIRAIQSLDMSTERKAAMKERKQLSNLKSEGLAASPPSSVKSNSASPLVTIRVRLRVLPPPADGKQR